MKILGIDLQVASASADALAGPARGIFCQLQKIHRSAFSMPTQAKHFAC